MMPEKTFNVQFSSQVYHVANRPSMKNSCEKTIHIKRLNGKKINRPSPYIISSNITSAKLNIINQGSAASISRIARLDYPDDAFGYELHFLESEGLPVFRKRSYNLQRKLSDVLRIQQSPQT